MESYICPSCKEEQTAAIRWETVSMAYSVDLENGECNEVDRRGGDFECCTCPGCGETLPEEITNQIPK